MPDFDLDPSHSGSGDFNVDNFDFGMDSFDPFTGQYLDQHLQPSYANGPQHNESIRPSDLAANAFADIGIFGASRPTQLPLQIDPSLTESKGRLGQQQTIAQSLTPPTSLSPERLDAIRPHQDSSEGAAAPKNPNTYKRKLAETDDGDANAERRLKNRVAASKCRVKKKGREQMLIQESDQKEQENLELRAECRRLTQEALWLKNQLITHGNCGDTRINKWLANSAAKIVHKFGEGPAFQLDASSHPAARSFAELEYERRDSGISTNSKPDSKIEHGSSPSTGPTIPVKIGLGSPVDDASTQNVRNSPVQLKSEADLELLGGKSIRRTRSLDHSILDALAVGAAGRAQSVPLQESDIPQHADGACGDVIPQDLSLKGQVSIVSSSASVAAPLTSAVNSATAVPRDAQLSVNAMIIDPRLRGGDMPRDLLQANLEHCASSIQQEQPNHDELLQIPETKWMEA